MRNDAASDGAETRRRLHGTPTGGCLIDGQMLETARTFPLPQPRNRRGARPRARRAPSPTPRRPSPPPGAPSTPRTGPPTSNCVCAASTSSTGRWSSTGRSSPRSPSPRSAPPQRCSPGAQLDQPIEIVRYYADLLKTYPMTEDLGNIEIRGMQHHRWVEKEAAGVVAAIIAYNYPNQLALAKLAPALAAGCTVVLKARARHPAHHAHPRQADRRAHRHPRRASSTCSARADPEVGARADHQPRRRHGHLHRLHADRPPDHGRGPRARLKRVFLELGGKSAAIVLDDADFNTAAMFAAFSVGHARRPGLRAHLPAAWCRAKRHDEIVEQIKNNFGTGALRRPDRSQHLHGPADQREASATRSTAWSSGPSRRAPPWSPAARRSTRATSIRRRC